MEKTNDVKCPKCQSNNCVVQSQVGLSIGCFCNDCKSTFIVLDGDGTPTLASE